MYSLSWVEWVVWSFSLKDPSYSPAFQGSWSEMPAKYLHTHLTYIHLTYNCLLESLFSSFSPVFALSLVFSSSISSHSLSRGQQARVCVWDQVNLRFISHWTRDTKERKYHPESLPGQVKQSYHHHNQETVPVFPSLSSQVYSVVITLSLSVNLNR